MLLDHLTNDLPSFSYLYNLFLLPLSSDSHHHPFGRCEECKRLHSAGTNTKAHKRNPRQNQGNRKCYPVGSNRILPIAKLHTIVCGHQADGQEEDSGLGDEK